MKNLISQYIIYVQLNYVNKTIMKKYVFTFIGILACLKMFAQLGYRCEGKFIELVPSTTNRYYVQTRNSESKKYLEEIASMEQRQNKSSNEVYMISDNSFFVSSKSTLLENDYFSVLFLDSKGNPYYILPRIILSLNDNVDISGIISRYTGILTLDSNQKLKGMITLSCNLSTAQDVLKLVAELDASNDVKWCEPDMICKWEIYDSNPLFPLQYYLQNNNNGQYDINVVPAWGIITGNENITVAVIDTGVDPDHEDLNGCVLQGYTVGDATGYGIPKNANAISRKGHGVACAGIIGAKDNDKGVLGVAYGVNILPVNIAPYIPYEYYENGKKMVYNGFTTSDSELAEAIQWAAERADVLSCSWGSDSDIGAVISAINSAMIYGRGGKGCVVVAASGNYYPEKTTVSFPARMNGVIAVGAIDKYGEIQSYSQRGSALDLVALSGDLLSSNIVTTDRMDTLGYNPYSIPQIQLFPELPPLQLSELTNTNYTQLFSGTSAACPQVAGVAALMLSYNSSLTMDSVRNILLNTACKLPDMNGLNRTDTFGYGLVDAYAAVSSIKHSISGVSALCDTATYIIAGLPSSFTVNWSIDNNNFTITPSGNQCLVSYIGTPQYSVANLTAIISRSGTTIKTLTKRIVMHGTNLSVTGWQYGYVSPNGTFPDRQFTIPSSKGSITIPDIFSMDDIFGKKSLPINFIKENTRDPHPPVDLCGYGITEINGGNTVYLNSTRFDGMNISFHSLYSPTYFNHSGNYVTFTMPYESTDYTMTLQANSEASCHDFCLKFKVIPLPGAASGDDEIWINLEGTMLYINFLPIDNTSSYNVTISKIPAGTQVYSNTFPGTQSSFSVNTSSWTSGFYSIRIVQGNNIYTKSIYI